MGMLHDDDDDDDDVCIIVSKIAYTVCCRQIYMLVESVVPLGAVWAEKNISHYRACNYHSFQGV